MSERLTSIPGTTSTNPRQVATSTTAKVVPCWGRRRSGVPVGPLAARVLRTTARLRSRLAGFHPANIPRAPIFNVIQRDPRTVLSWHDRSRRFAVIHFCHPSKLMMPVRSRSADLFVGLPMTEVAGRSVGAPLYLGPPHVPAGSSPRDVGKVDQPFAIATMGSEAGSWVASYWRDMATRMSSWGSTKWS